MAEGMQKLLVCLLFCGFLLSSGCVSSRSSIMPIEKNNSSDAGNYAEYSTTVAQQMPSQDTSPKNSSILPKLPDIPRVPQPKEVPNSSLKLEGIFAKGNLTGLMPAGAMAKAWTGENEDGAKYFPLLPGGTATLADGTRLELASLNSDWSKGGVWATFVIGGTRRTINVGQVSEAGNWSVRAMDLYLPPDKVFASFLLSDFGTQKELNLTAGTSIYTSSQDVYDVAGIYSGYAGNFSAVLLTEGTRQHMLVAGEEQPLPLG